MKEEESSIEIERSLLTSATDDEIHVAQILLDLAGLIRARELGPGIKWGSRKRRSGLDEVELPYQKTDVGVEHTPRKAETAAASSPITPLAFSPSESDDQRSKHLSQKTPKIMARKVYVDMIEELSQRGDLLRREVEKVRDYHKKLIAQNSQLKAIKQEAERKEKLKLEKIINGNLGMELIPKNHEMGAAQLNNGLGSSNHVGPFGSPVVNRERLPYQPLDADGRSRSAEARRRRMDIIRFKSMRRAAFKYSRTR